MNKILECDGVLRKLFWVLGIYRQNSGGWVWERVRNFGGWEVGIFGFGFWIFDWGFLAGIFNHEGTKNKLATNEHE